MMLSYKASFIPALATAYCSLANHFLEPKWYTKPWFLYPWLPVCCFSGFKDIHLHTSKAMTQPSRLITAIKLTSVSFQIISATWQLSICQTDVPLWSGHLSEEQWSWALKQQAADADKALGPYHTHITVVGTSCLADGLHPFFWRQILDSLGEETI